MPRAQHLFSLWAVQLILSAGFAAAGETVTDQALDFSLTVPAGFDALESLPENAPKIRHGFIYGDPDDEYSDILLFIEELDGELGRERLRKEDMPPGFNARLFTTTWQGFEVDAFEVPEQADGRQYLTYNVQIPLKGSAIQVKLFGSAGRKAELNELLAEVLGGLRGESNWIPGALESHASDQDDYRYVLLAVAAVIVLGGSIALWIISRWTPRGSILAVAFAIWILGQMLEGFRIREVILVGGSLKMLGTIGVILGIVDLVRRRKPKKSAEPTVD